MLDTKERCSDLHCSNFQADSDTVPAGGRAQAINKLILSAAKAGAAGQGPRAANEKNYFKKLGLKHTYAWGKISYLKQII